MSFVPLEDGSAAAGAAVVVIVDHCLTAGSVFSGSPHIGGNTIEQNCGYNYQ